MAAHHQYLAQLLPFGSLRIRIFVKPVLKDENLTMEMIKLLLVAAAGEHLFLCEPSPFSPVRLLLLLLAANKRLLVLVLVIIRVCIVNLVRQKMWKLPND